VDVRCNNKKATENISNKMSIILFS